MPTASLRLKPTPPFDFYNTISSHGWVVLAPNTLDKEKQAFRRVEQLPGGEVVCLEVLAEGDAVRLRVESQGALAGVHKNLLRRRVAHMLRLDDDYTTFYRIARKRGRPWSRLARGLGRMFRSPTVWEDAVKTMLTTNIAWGGTKRMAATLVEEWGAPYPPDPSRRAFPSPQAIAAVPFKRFEAKAGLGYRAPYIHELARRIMGGELDLQAWLDPAIPSDELYRQLLAVKGIGPYAAANLLMLLGRYDRLGFDTVYRDFVGPRYFNGKKPTEKEMLAVYDDWGEWKYLAYWFEMLLEETP
jgi:3-methyladenine DNA glycosylase/8-oxoguanine DNA glycosylase